MEIKHRSELHKLIKPGSHVAEVGVAEGRFSAEMAAWPQVYRLYLVDRWATAPGQKGDGGLPQSWHDQNFAGMKKRVDSFAGKVVLLRGDSHLMAAKVPDQSLSLVYIDADHAYESVKRDILAWLPKVKIGGVMAFHDYLAPHYGVNLAVNEFAKGRYTVHLIPENRPCDASAWFVAD